MYATSSIMAHEDCRKAEADGGCRILAADAMGAAWSDEGLLSLAPSSPARSACTALSCEGSAALPLEHSRHVTTMRASGRPRAVRLPSDDACSTHCQIPARVSTSHPRVPAALRPIAGPARSGRHLKPASVDGPSFVPARPIPVFRRVYGVPDP
jgi:hypothetical protein